MRLLVTGGAGFIGSNFVLRVLAEREEMSITVIDSLTYAGRMDNLAGATGFESRFRFVEGDIRDSEKVDDLVADCDVIVHFAAESHNDNSLVNPKIFLETNFMGTFNLIQSAVKHGVRFHHISTDEVFGDLPLNSATKFKPDTPYNPSSPYSASKAASDHLVRAWVRSFGLEATISNCSNNYGPRQHEEKFIPRTILLAARGIRPKIYGDGLNVRDWIHVDDHTDGVLAILDRGAIGETYLLGANGEATNIEVVRSILSLMGIPQDFIEFVKNRPGHDLRYAIDATKTHSELGWLPKYASLEQGLPKVIEHYLSNASQASDLSFGSHSATKPK
ncbi:MAG: hypothetical protein RL196_1514 [Actinomycetota bacterium]|jgi:dTDP-glucose 4,6-dehydratase